MLVVLILLFLGSLFTFFMCMGAAVECVVDKNFHGGIGFGVLSLLCIAMSIILVAEGRRNLNDERETVVVKNVIEYQVDTTTVINGADTTRTYKISYKKSYGKL